MKGFLRRFGVNRAVAYGVLTRVTSGTLGVATFVLIAWRFPPAVQGYHFTFLNLLLLQVFAELGLLTVLVPFASHEWSRLSLDADGRVRGDEEARSRLAGLGRFAFAWFLGAGVAVALLLGTGGWIFFSRSGASDVAWQGPWTALCALTGLRMLLLPALGLLEGSNQMADLYFLRWTGALVFGVSTAAGIAAGLGLWSAAAGTALEIAWTSGRLLVRHGRFLGLFRERPSGPVVSWARDIRPLQARIAASWIAGYVGYHVFTPLLFRWHGPEAAGRWGMTWNMFLLVTSVAGTWIAARSAQFGIWIARREFEALDRDFGRLLRISVALTAAGAAAVWGGIAALAVAGHPWAVRVLPPDAAAVLAAAVVLTQVTFAHAAYLRAHRKEPLVPVSLAQAAASAVGALLLGAPRGVQGMALAFLGGAVVALVGGAWVWTRCRRLWHAALPGGPTA